MAEQPLRDHVYHGATVSLCPQCRATIPGKILFRGEKVFMRKHCPRHGTAEVLIHGDRSLFLQAERMLLPGELPLKFSSSVREGCPEDCGVCPEHEQRCAMPVVEITNHCNLDCPICFAHNDGNYHMTPEELERCLDRIEECEGIEKVDVLVVSGGEPTVHPGFEDLMARACRRGFGRIAVNTNGLRLGEDDRLARFLGESGIHATLQLDSLRPGTYERLRGRDLTAAKARALEAAARHGIDLNVLQTAVRGINEDEIGAIARLALLENDCVRGLNIHVMTYTGKGGTTFPRDPLRILTGTDVLEALEEQTGGLLRKGDFTPMPFPHPRCALITYAIVAGGKLYPFSRFMPPERYLPLLTRGAIASPDESFRDALEETVNEIWAGGRPAPDGAEVLAVLRDLVKALFPADRKLTDAERKKIAQAHVKSVFIHSYMDELTFDLTRLKKCCSMQVLPDGRMIPNCAYYVVHRRRDPRFFPMRCF